MTMHAFKSAAAAGALLAGLIATPVMAQQTGADTETDLSEDGVMTGDVPSEEATGGEAVSSEDLATEAAETEAGDSADTDSEADANAGAAGQADAMAENVTETASGDAAGGSMTGLGDVEPRYTTMEKYGFCGSIDDTCYNDWYDRTSGEEEAGKILIYYEVAAGVGPHDNREAGVAVLESMFEDAGYEVEATEDPAFMESGFSLRPFDTIVFFNTGRDALTSLGLMSLRIYMEGGGGFVGIHNAFGTNFNNTWFEGLLGTQLFDHAPRQTATVVPQSSDPSVEHLDGVEFGPEEFYNVHPDPRWLEDIRILLTVDEATMTEGTGGYYGHPGMGEGHPVSWCHYYDGGRAWLTTLGHSVEILVDPNWQEHIMAGIEGTMGNAPFCTE